MKRFCSKRISLLTIYSIIFLFPYLSCFPLVTIASTSSYGYITNSESDDVSVIDTTSNSVIAKISVGDRPIGVACNPKGKRVYVTNVNSGTVSVIDTTTNMVKATIPVGSWPLGIDVTPDGGRVYVANMRSSSVSVIDASNNTVVSNIQVGGIPEGLAITPDGRRVYVPNGTLSYTTVIDTSTNKVITRIPVGNYALGVAITPAGNKVYVGNHNDHNVSVIDTRTNGVIATIPDILYPAGIAINPAGTLAYVAGSGKVYIIDIRTNTVTSTIPLRLGSGLGISVSIDGTRIYVAQPEQNYISVFDTSMKGLITTIAVGKNPRAFGNFIGELATKIPIPIRMVKSGTGFLLTTNGLVATNFHVVEDANKIEVVFPEKKITKIASVRIKDTKNDIVILDLKDFMYPELTSRPIPFVFAHIQSVKVGQEVFTLGFPLGDIMGSKSRLSTGIINSQFGIQDDPRLFQISNPIQPGNSGGPLFNIKGELVGVVVASLNVKYLYEKIGIIPQNVNFALKVNYLHNLVSMIPESSEIFDRKNIVRQGAMENLVEQLNPFIVQVNVY
jgi:YVTN family beta-propeller protein